MLIPGVNTYGVQSPEYRALSTEPWHSRYHTSEFSCALQAGDVLLLDTGAQFLPNHKSDRNFALVAEVANSQPPRFDRVAIACVSAVAALCLTIAGVLELFTAAALASAVMLLTGCISGNAARQAAKWDVYVTIAAAFGLSQALDGTGEQSHWFRPALFHAPLLATATVAEVRSLTWLLPLCHSQDAVKMA